MGYFKDYPKHVFLILGNEFCERFSFYGMKAILVLYFTRSLNFSDDAATAFYHAFNTICYFLAILGAVMADGYLGKFRTILYLSFVYVLGNAAMALGAIPQGGNYLEWVTYIALILIAVGTGGIKPCVSAFGADQFKEHQVRQKETFFSMFYMSINVGSLISMILTPILRTSVQCYGGDCYPLAFGIPACLMVVSVVFFIAGSTLYTKNPPGESLISRLFGCIGHALSGKCGNKGGPKDHWLDYSEEKYGREFVRDVKAVLKVLFMFIPLPVFWALYDQQGSRWILQAGQMDGDFGSFVMQPDQMQVVNPILIVMMVPLMESLFFPCLDKLHIPNRPLQRLTAGLFLCALSFAFTGGLQVIIESNAPAAVPEGNTRVHYINAAPCDVTITAGSIEYPDTLLSYGEKADPLDVPNESANHSLTASFTNCKFGLEDKLGESFTVSDLSGSEAFALVFSYKGSPQLIQHPQNQTTRTLQGQSTVWLSSVVQDLQIRLNDDDETDRNLTVSGEAQWFELVHKKFDVMAKNISEDEDFIKIGEIDSKSGAIYTAIIQYDDNRVLTVKQHEEVDPNNINIFCQLPQYVVMGFGEVLFSVTGLSFAYAEAPTSMKSVLQAGWLLTTAMGNLIDVIVAGAGIPNRIVEYFFFCGLMLVTTIIFIVMTMFYVYVADLPPQEEDEEKKPETLGHDNTAYQSDAALAKAKEAEIGGAVDLPPQYEEIDLNAVESTAF